MLHVNTDYIDNNQGMIYILIGLESANLLLREIHYVAGIPVQKSFFTKDIMLGNSVLTNKMVMVMVGWNSEKPTVSIIQIHSLPTCWEIVKPKTPLLISKMSPASNRCREVQMWAKL